MHATIACADALRRCTCVCLFVCAFAYFIIFHIYSHDFLAFYARARIHPRRKHVPLDELISAVASCVVPAPSPIFPVHPHIIIVYDRDDAWPPLRDVFSEVLQVEFARLDAGECMPRSRPRAGVSRVRTRLRARALGGGGGKTRLRANLVSEEDAAPNDGLGMLADNLAPAHPVDLARGVLRRDRRRPR